MYEYLQFSSPIEHSFPYSFSGPPLWPKSSSWRVGGFLVPPGGFLIVGNQPVLVQLPEKFSSLLDPPRPQVLGHYLDYLELDYDTSLREVDRDIKDESTGNRGHPDFNTLLTRNIAGHPTGKIFFLEDFAFLLYKA